MSLNNDQTRDFVDKLVRLTRARQRVASPVFNFMGITTTTNQRAGGFRLIKDSKSATTVTDPYGSDDIINASMRTAGYGSLDYQSALRQQEIKIFISYSPMAAVELNSLLRGINPATGLISADNDYYSESNIDNKLISLYAGISEYILFTAACAAYKHYGNPSSPVVMEGTADYLRDAAIAAAADGSIFPDGIIALLETQAYAAVVQNSVALNNESIFARGGQSILSNTPVNGYHNIVDYSNLGRLHSRQIVPGTYTAGTVTAVDNSRAVANRSIVTFTAGATPLTVRAADLLQFSTSASPAFQYQVANDINGTAANASSYVPQPCVADSVSNPDGLLSETRQYTIAPNTSMTIEVVPAINSVLAAAINAAPHNIAVADAHSLSLVGHYGMFDGICQEQGTNNRATSDTGAIEYADEGGFIDNLGLNIRYTVNRSNTDIKTRQIVMDTRIGIGVTYPDQVVRILSEVGTNPARPMTYTGDTTRQYRRV